jgi:hypothetical protein
MEKYIRKYQFLVRQGICAHTAACYVMAAMHTDNKDEGLTDDESFQRQRELLVETKKEWE